MQVIVAQNVELLADLDYGEGYVAFRWDDELYGYDELVIDLEGHCSRRMPIHSGNGPPEFVNLSRDRLYLRLDPDLARKLLLEEEIEIRFSLPDADFQVLAAVIADFNDR